MLQPFLPTILVLPLLFSGCGPAEEDLREMISEEMKKGTKRAVISPTMTAGPYSPGVRVGNFLFVSGQIGLDQETGFLRSDDIETETRQTLENLMSILRAAGYDSSHVVSSTVYLADIEDYAKMNLIYGGYFGEGNYPARSTVEVDDLPRGANVEISMIAYKEDLEM